jgi:hypothetical protein
LIHEKYLKSVRVLFQKNALWYKHTSVNSIVFEFYSEGDAMERGDREPVEVICTKCRYTEIIYLPIEDLPLCPKCNIQMSISELLDEGKSY